MNKNMRDLKDKTFLLHLQADERVDIVEALQDILEEAVPKHFIAYSFKDIKLPKLVKMSKTGRFQPKP